MLSPHTLLSPLPTPPSLSIPSPNRTSGNRFKKLPTVFKSRYKPIAESNHYPYVPDTGSTKTPSSLVPQKTGSLFQEMSLNSPPPASSPYSETDAAEVGSSGRMMTRVTVPKKNASSRLFSLRPDTPCERKKQATVARA